MKMKLLWLISQYQRRLYKISIGMHRSMKILFKNSNIIKIIYYRDQDLVWGRDRDPRIRLAQNLFRVKMFTRRRDFCLVIGSALLLPADLFHHKEGTPGNVLIAISLLEIHRFLHLRIQQGLRILCILQKVII
jgi:hypothetical protein